MHLTKMMANFLVIKSISYMQLKCHFVSSGLKFSQNTGSSLQWPFTTINQIQSITFTSSVFTISRKAVWVSCHLNVFFVNLQFQVSRKKWNSIYKLNIVKWWKKETYFMWITNSMQWGVTDNITNWNQIRKRSSNNCRQSGSKKCLEKCINTGYK